MSTSSTRRADRPAAGRTGLRALTAAAALLLAAQAHAAPVQVADSASEFSGVQGQDGWEYGYYLTDGDPATFTRMTLFDAGAGQWKEVPTPPPWTALWADGGHPGSLWAVRRWVSEVSGTIEITGLLEDLDPGGGDGVIGRILVDGTEVWRGLVDAAPGTPALASKTFTVTVPSVSVGALVDFAIDPIWSQGWDATRFTATIFSVTASPPPGAVPAPPTALLLAAGLAGLLGGAGRRRRRAGRGRAA